MQGQKRSQPSPSTAVATQGCTVNGVRNQPCEGTDANDVIVGTTGDDMILGGGGHEKARLRARRHLEWLCGQTGETAWTAPLSGDTAAAPAPDAKKEPGKGRRGGGGRGGFGSIVDAGSVLFALTPNGNLVVFAPSDKEFKKVASYKVATSETYACPVPCAKGLYVKDQESLTLWAFD